MKQLVIVANTNTDDLQLKIKRALTMIKNINISFEITLALFGNDFEKTDEVNMQSFGINQIFYYENEDEIVSFHELIKKWKEDFTKLQADFIVFLEQSSSNQLAVRLATLFETEAILNVTSLSTKGEKAIILKRKQSLLEVDYIEVSRFPIIFSLRLPYIMQNKKEKFDAYEIERKHFTAKGLEVTSYHKEKINEPFANLESAEVVVAGGRGVRTNEAFDQLKKLARCFPNSAVGASGGANELEWFEEHLLIGQTGKKIKPSLYFACGISGANQHLGGIIEADILVAINRDPNAYIFEICDFGIVGDVEEVLPTLIKEIKKNSQITLF